MQHILEIMWWKNGWMCDCKLCAKFFLTEIVRVQNDFVFFLVCAFGMEMCAFVYFCNQIRDKIENSEPQEKTKRCELCTSTSAYWKHSHTHLHARRLFILCINFTYIKQSSKLCLMKRKRENGNICLIVTVPVSNIEQLTWYIGTYDTHFVLIA